MSVHQVLDSLVDPIMLIDEGVLSFSNLKLRQLTGSGVVGIPLQQAPFIAEHDRLPVSDIAALAVKNNCEKKTITTIIRDPCDGSKRPPIFCELAFSPIDETSVSCVFKPLPELGSPNWWQFVGEQLDVKAWAVEIPEDEKDLIVLWASPAIRADTQYKDVVLPARLVADVGFMAGDVGKMIAQLKSIEGKKELGHFSDQVTIPSGGQWYYWATARFIGYSETNGRPRFLRHTVLYTTLQDLEKKFKLRSSKEVEHLVELNKILQRLFEVAPLCMGAVDISDGFINPRYLLRNNSICDLTKEQWCKLVTPEIEQAREKSKEAHFFEKKLETYDQERDFYCMLSWYQAVTYLYLLMDITYQKRLEQQLTEQQAVLEDLVKTRTEQLQAALEIRSRMLAITSHEIWNPLSSMLATLSALQETELTPEMEQLVQTAADCGEKLLNVVSDILEFSRLDDGKVQLQHQPLSMHKVIEKALEIVFLQTAVNDVELVWDVDPMLCNWVVGDTARLRQILLNLLSNAVKFSHSNGVVLLNASSQDLPDDKVKFIFAIRDFGIGIPPEALPKLFNAFMQSDTSMTRKYAGSGLGLAISRQLIELMGGEISVESTEGEGSVFRFHVTLDKDTSHSNISDWPTLRGHHVLVVAKNDFVRNAVCASIESCGAYPVPRETVQEAVIYLEAQSTRPLSMIITTDLQDVEKLIEFGSPVYYMGRSMPRSYPVCFVKRPLMKSLLFEIQCALGCTGDACRFPAERGERCRSTCRILIVDDNLAMLRLERNLLDQMGYVHVTTACNGPQALKIVEGEEAFDIILLDVMMPHMNGLQCAQLIRKMHLSKEPYIVGLTSHPLPVATCLRAGMDEAVSKPIDKNKLEEIIARADYSCPPED